MRTAIDKVIDAVINKAIHGPNQVMRGYAGVAVRNALSAAGLEIVPRRRVTRVEGLFSDEWLTAVNAGDYAEARRVCEREMWAR